MADDSWRERPGYCPNPPHGALELLLRVQRSNSRRAVAGMTDPELEQWVSTCSLMAARPSRANSAHRVWRQLLRDARAEIDIRQARASRNPSR
jgi:hypothetical protein